MDNLELISKEGFMALNCLVDVPQHVTKNRPESNLGKGLNLHKFKMAARSDVYVQLTF